HRIELVWYSHEPNPGWCGEASRTVRDRPSVQPAAPDPGGRGRWGRPDVGNRLQAALAREVYYLVANDVLSAEDVDTALSWGPGLRWGLMGNMMLNHLGGGPGGIRDFFEQLAR